jgi:imidazolonepropionase-like amidohydrolase
VVLTLASASAVPAADIIPARKQSQPIAIVGGTIHTISGDVISSGTVVIEGGKISALGEKITPPENAEVIDAKGKHVYPGMIDAFSNIGLVEIDAVRATRDFAEVGEINPNVKAQIGVNPDSEIIPVTRSNGVLLAHTVPQSGVIAGQTALLQLDGWTWEDLTLKAPIGMHVQWPYMSPVSAWWEEKSAKEQVEQRDKQLKELEQAFEDARAYQKARSAEGSTQPYDSRWEAMLPVLAGKLPLIASADNAGQIQSAVAFATRHKVKLVIYGGYDAELCAELLKKYEIPVIVASVYRLPMRRHEDYDAAYTLPKRLQTAGVKFCIAGGARFGASNVRNLPYHAATAAAFGLSPEEALKAITLSPAEILGVADRVGSLEPGKDATLFIANGDILETATHVEAAFIAGRKIDLDDKQKRLWRKYQQRYERDAVDKEAAE